MKKIYIILMATTLAVAAGAQSARIEEQPSGLWDFASGSVAGIKIGWNSRAADVVATMRTKMGDTVSWESWGAVDATLDPAPNRPPNRDNKRYVRYPRAFKATLKNQNPKTEVGFDLYDVGAQRNHKPVHILFERGEGITLTLRPPGGAATTTVPVEIGKEYVIRQANYNPAQTEGAEADTVEYGVTLSFKGPLCIFWIPRDKGKPDGPDGSPPPPDPGDDTSEQP